MLKKLYYILLIVFLPSIMFAQVTQFPYICSFEETEDLSAWVLNPKTPDNTDLWMMGTATFSDGKRSLYISDKGGEPHFGKKPNVSVAYLRYKFPDADGQKNYDLSFDWKCIGVEDAAMLYVMVCPERIFLNEVRGSEGNFLDNILSKNAQGLLPNVVIQACAQLGPNSDRALLNSQQWVNTPLTADIRVSSRNSKEVFVIAFIWVNSNTAADLQAMGACIDNIQIASARLQKPQKLAVETICEDSTMRVSWESVANNFVVEYRTVGTTTWRRADDLTEGTQYFEKNGLLCAYYLQRIFEGSYDVRVKCALGNDTSAYSSVNNILMYCPYNHCINYLDLDNPYLVCTYGTVESHQGGSPYANIGYINFPDKDPDSRKMSRHTIMTDPKETDPKTNDELMCVPKGELGSVRLGNWNTSYEAESMTYTFSVDSTNASILLVKYAIVLNKPNTTCGDPGMKMELFDEDGNPLTDLCGVPDFTYSSAVASGTWNETKDGSVVWKDWTTVGINLMQYAGQNIKVRLTTRDCGGGGHFGYGYFCLDCASAYIETENCGSDAQIVCQAPEGFSYTWRDENGTIVGYDKQLEVDAGMHTYTCRVAFIDEPSCYFEVSTVSAPRFPVPEFKVQIEPSECMNRVRFINKSHIMNKYYGYELHTSEICNDQEWTFTRYSDGKENKTSNYGPVYVAPAEGDTVLVRLRVFTGDHNQCDSTMDSIIVIPSIVNTDSTEYLELCQGEGYKFCGRYYAAERDTVLADTSANYAGCDSIYTLHLKVHYKTPEQFRHDSICSDSAIFIGDKMFNEPGTYTVFLTNQYGCDSIITTNLTVNQLIATAVTSDIPMITCADGENLVVDFRVWAGEYDSIRLVYDSTAHAAGFRDTMTTEPGLTSMIIPYTVATYPGRYFAELEFHQFCCGVTSFTIPFVIKYRSSIVEQKWNDVLSVLSKKYNGGYDFISYQWYKNDKPIVGATGSYLYEPLDTTAYYHVVLMRGDSVAIASCPITPTVHQDISKFPTLAKTSQMLKVQLAQPAQIRIFTVSGQLYSDQRFGEGIANIAAPAVVGAYVVEIIMLDGEHTSQYLIVGH